MKRLLLLALLLLALEVAPVQANGLGLFRRPTEVRYSYYTPAVVYYPVAPPPVYYPMVPAQPIGVAPPLVEQWAVPIAAPPSTTAEPPRSSAPRAGEARSMRVGESFYQVLPGPLTMGKDGEKEHCSIAFWNLTQKTLTLRINDRDTSIAPNRSVTLDLPQTFAWRIDGREAEATQIPKGHGSAEILIRR